MKIVFSGDSSNSGTNPELLDLIFSGNSLPFIFANRSS